MAVELETILSDAKVTINVGGTATPLGKAIFDRASGAQVPPLNVNSSSDAAGEMSAAIASMNQIAGGRPRLPAKNYPVGPSSVILKSGIAIEGQGPSISNDYATGTMLKALPGSQHICKAGNDDPIHSAGLHDLAMDGRNLPPGGACIRAGFLESRFTSLSLRSNGTIEGGFSTTLGFDHLPTFPASWINWNMNCLISGFGIGKRMGGSDSLEFGHYLSSNGIGWLLQGTTGSTRYLGTMVDLCNTGTVIESPPSSYYGNYSPPYSNVTMVGNIYHFNKQHHKIKFVPENGYSDIQVAHSYVANVYNNSTDPDQTAFSVDSHLYGGFISGCVFAQNARPVELEFGGVSNTGWMINFSSDKPANGRILNIPPDAHVLTGGPGGQYNYLTQLTIGNGVDVGPTYPFGNPGFSSYGGATVLGINNVVSRLGLSRDRNGFDAALLAGVDNGNTPFFSTANGEKTATAGLNFKHNNTVVFGINSRGKFSISGLVDAPNDVSAAASGVAINEVYRNGSALMIRVG